MHGHLKLFNKTSRDIKVDFIQTLPHAVSRPQIKGKTLLKQHFNIRNSRISHQDKNWALFEEILLCEPICTSNLSMDVVSLN